MCLNARSIIGTDRRKDRLRPARLLNPSISMRRSTRSRTNDSEIPNSVKFWGIAGWKAERIFGAKVAMSVGTFLPGILSAGGAEKFTMIGFRLVEFSSFHFR